MILPDINYFVEAIAEKWSPAARKRITKNDGFTFLVFLFRKNWFRIAHPVLGFHRVCHRLKLQRPQLRLGSEDDGGFLDHALFLSQQAGEISARLRSVLLRERGDRY